MKKVILSAVLAILVASPVFASGGSKSGYATGVTSNRSSSASSLDQLGNIRIDSNKVYMYVKAIANISADTPVAHPKNVVSSDTGFVVTIPSQTDPESTFAGFAESAIDSGNLGWVVIRGAVDNAGSVASGKALVLGANSAFAVAGSDTDRKVGVSLGGGWIFIK